MPNGARARQERFVFAGEPSRDLPRYHQEAEALYQVLVDGAPAPPFHVRRGFWLRDARRRPLRWSYTDEWRPARELDGRGEEVDRALNPFVVARALAGDYDVAWKAPSWTSLVVFDIDLPAATTPEEAIEATRQRDAVLTELWEVLGFDEETEPVVLLTPGQGYHVYMPLDQPWPAGKLRGYVAERLAAAGVGIRPGRLEVFPAGQRLRIPCGRGMALLCPRNPNDAEDLRLELRHARVVAGGDGGGRLVREVGPLVRAFLARLAEARRPLEAWLGPRYRRDETWGPWLRREPDETPPGAASQRSQHTWRCSYRSPGGGAAPLSSAEPVLLRGAVFRAACVQLLEEGLSDAGTRHDALLKLAFYFGRTLGASRASFEAELRRWLEGFAHASAARRANPSKFVRDSLREALHYFDALEASGIPASPTRTGGHLAPCDRDLLGALDARVRPELGSILRYLKTFSDSGGRVGEAVNLSSHILRQLCGERRIVVDVGGQRRRRRATVLAIEELERAGVLTLHLPHLKGRHGRLYCCWYRFGSGRLPSVDGEGTRLLASREVFEGRLDALSEGGKLVLRLTVTASTVPPAGSARGAYRPWWLDLYRQPFTPAEFEEAAAGTVLAGPWRPRRTVPLRLEFAERLAVDVRARSDEEAATEAPGSAEAGQGLAPTVYDAELGRAVRRLVLWERRRSKQLSLPGELGAVGDRERHAAWQAWFQRFDE